ncbi:MAG: PAS domain S-box protein, partial [Pseudomonadales bacterium]|nr:PAS domain S-box protein [Pseudomonadales bacterium]
VVSDVSELRRTQQALSSSTVRGQTILDTAVDAIVTIDEDGVIQSCNASCSKLFGFAASEMLGRNVKMLMPGAYAGEHDGYLKRYRETGEKHIIGIGREVTGRKSNGSEFPAHLAVGEFSNMGRRYFTGFIRDMTDQRAAEEAARRHLDELAHVTRIHAIDSLAAGISHEVNQPLTAIVTMSQALLRTLRNGNLPEAMLIDTLERVVTQATRASSIVTQMREMVRKQKSEEVSLQYVDEIVSDVLDLLQDELRNNNIEVRQEPPLRRHHVMANRIQVEQVMLNLIQNAVHAMADNDDERILRIVNAADEDKRFVEVRVQDSGPGLPTGDGADVFSPFFTTKEKGLGQGLTISRAIAERHGGSLDAMPAATRGALFSFRLPFADGE